ncbi:YadA-like family protein [uncultured Phascolarctobacterium sp.]|uniref:YadA-like family protein n=1 Tax=uncultured Phascolarctobacterium sp. TaxID=512296 RepID=UPI0025F56D77|nr:YadA-like family protein [uncultured Phascolarctobacterium sp.]
MKKTILMSAAKKARIALAVMALCGMSFVGAQEAFAENVTVDYNSNIIGAGNPAYVTGRYNVVLGIVTEANGESNVAIGDSAKTKGYSSTAVGAGSKAENGGAAVGRHSQATSENSIALGTEAKASATGAVALGALSTADEENTVSIGGIYQEIVGYDPTTRDYIYENKLLTRRIVNVADGTKDTDAATFGQIIKAGEYNLTLAADGSGQVTLQTNAGANGPTIKVNASALAGGGSTLTQEQFNDMLDANTKFTGLQTAVGNKANANGDNITTGAGSQWADKLGTGAIENGNNNLVNGGTVYNKIGDTSQLTTAGLGNNLSDAVVKVNTKAEAAQTTATNALNKANANETKIGDTGKLTTAGLGDNLSDAVVKVNDKVGNTSKLTTANLGNNLSDAVVKVDDKTKQNAKDIEKVNGRVDELGGRVDTLGGAVAKLDSRVNKVGAGAAALAALHPMEFDSDNKLSFAAGVGNYRGTNAAAIGAFYRPSEQVMFSISGNMGNGENMVNAGVSFALDRPSKTPTTKAALVKTVVAQNEQIATLNETVAEQNEKIARLEAMVEKLAAKQNA